MRVENQFFLARMGRGRDHDRPLPHGFFHLREPLRMITVYAQLLQDESLLQE